MLVAKDGSGFRCVARQSEKAGSPYFCPVCGEETLLKKGRVRVHHFSHKSKSECRNGVGESQHHLQAKEAIYEALSQHPDCRKCELERILDGVRPDVSLYVGNHPVAIEVQKSKIEISDIKRRFNRYRELKINLIWVIPGLPEKVKTRANGDKYVNTLPEWQKFLHACYFGRLYFWTEEAFVQPFHFGGYREYLTKGNWVEDACDKVGEDLSGTDWYQQNHLNADYGGYWRYSKSKMTLHCPPEDQQVLHLADDFRSGHASTYKSKHWTTPERKIWQDKLKKWW